jgi:lipopolysaccharide assembly outer membrane protein LptD (OstA)
MIPLYSTADSSLERSSSDFIFGANARITKDLSFRSMTQYNPEQSSSKRVAYGFKYNPQAGKLLKFDYRFIEFPSTNETRLKQFNLAGQWPLGQGYYAIGRYNFDLENSKVNGIFRWSRIRCRVLEFKGSFTSFIFSNGTRSELHPLVSIRTGRPW